MAQRIIVGVTGASGSIYAIRLLQVLHEIEQIETHLVISAAAKQTLSQETDYRLSSLEALATKVYDNQNIAASLSSGSFQTQGMIVVPCSIKTLSAIANSYADSLIYRAADVTLKERRPLILALRETPLHLGHLRLMIQAVEAGATIMPLMPAFYHRPETVMQLVDQLVNRLLDQLNITLPMDLFQRWCHDDSTE